MTVFDSRLTRSVRRPADHNRSQQTRPARDRADEALPALYAPTGQVGWVAALVWPAVSTAVVAGALLGSEGHLLLGAGIVGATGMFVRQGVKVVRRSVRTANLVIDNAPTGR